MSSWQCFASAQASGDGRVDLPYHRKMAARELDEGIAVVGEYAPRRRIAVLDNVRVLAS
jgi:hypothetical protein